MGPALYWILDAGLLSGYVFGDVTTEAKQLKKVTKPAKRAAQMSLGVFFPKRAKSEDWSSALMEAFLFYYDSSES